MVEARGLSVALAAKDPFDSPGSPVAHSQEVVAHILAAGKAAVRTPAEDNPEDSLEADIQEAFLAADSHSLEAACIPEGSLAADIPVADTGNLGGSPAVDILEALARVVQIL